MCIILHCICIIVRVEEGLCASIRDLLHSLYYYTYASSASGLDGSSWQKMATIVRIFVVTWQRMDKDPDVQKIYTPLLITLYIGRES